MSEPNAKPSESSVQLDKILTEGGAEAEAIAARFHRTMLWKLRTGRRGPELETAVELERLSGGRILHDGWLKPGSGEHPIVDASGTGTDGGKS